MVVLLQQVATVKYDQVRLTSDFNEETGQCPKLNRAKN